MLPTSASHLFPGSLGETSTAVLAERADRVLSQGVAHTPPLHAVAASVKYRAALEKPGRGNEVVFGREADKDGSARLQIAGAVWCRGVGIEVMGGVEEEVIGGVGGWH
jgi:hypothetical protein